MEVNKQKLEKWCNDALVGDLTWFKARKHLWEDLKECRKSPDYYISRTDWITFQSFLLARSEKVNDDKMLSFQTSVNRVIEDIENDHSDDDDAERESKSKSQDIKS